MFDVVKVVLLFVVVSPELLPEPGRLRDLDDDEDVQNLKPRTTGLWGFDLSVFAAPFNLRKFD